MVDLIIYTKWGPQTIAKLVYNSNNYMVYGTYNYSIHGVYKPTNITGGPHLVYIPSGYLLHSHGIDGP